MVQKLDSLWTGAKRVASVLPAGVQQELHRLHHRWEQSRRRFTSEEPEFAVLHEVIEPGTWALDVGANVGRYTLRLSEVVGPQGRVIAFEPVPATFELLAANARRAPHPNVTLVAAAASDRTAEAGICVPSWDDGRPNFYMAKLRETGGDFSVLTVPIDALGIGARVGFAKIDAEGHELGVLAGMRRLVERDRPLLLVEESSAQLFRWAKAHGLAALRMTGSPNLWIGPPETTAWKRVEEIAAASV